MVATAWTHWLGLFAAGGCGVCLRHALARWVDARAAAMLGLEGVHAGTLVVNLLGCLAIGGLASAVPAGPLRLAVIAGLLGGFTTYSSFALLTVELAEAGRWGPALLQVGAHVAGGVAMVLLGAWIVGRGG